MHVDVERTLYILEITGMHSEPTLHHRNVPVMLQPKWMIKMCSPKLALLRGKKKKKTFSRCQPRKCITCASLNHRGQKYLWRKSGFVTTERVCRHSALFRTSSGEIPQPGCHGDNRWSDDLPPGGSRSMYNWSLLNKGIDRSFLQNNFSWILCVFFFLLLMSFGEIYASRGNNAH